jgi:anti-sigma regulatory factor (Ser/Thr protein kinase)
VDSDAGEQPAPAGSPAAPATVRLAFPPEPRLLGTVRLVVGIVARKAGMDDEGIEDLKVAVSEACALAVADLNRAARPDPIELDLHEAADRLGIEVRDRAPSASRLTAVSAVDGEVDVDDRQLGLALVGALVDDLAIADLEGGGSRTSFSLRRGPEPPPPPT